MNEFLYRKATRRLSPHEEIQSKRLIQQLTNYRKLREEEKNLQARVDFLEKKAVRYGPMRVPVDLAMLLKEEKAELEALRREVDLREKELEGLESLPVQERSRMAEDRLKQLIRDIKAKREQILTYQGNMNYLEEKQAKLGLDGGVDLFNELKLTRESMNEVRAQLNELEKHLKEEWNLDPRSLQNIDKMDEEEIKAFVIETVSRLQELAKKQAGDRIEASAKRYDELVLGVLEELRQAAYPASDVKRNFRLDPQIGLSWRGVSQGEAGWEIFYIEGYGRGESKVHGVSLSDVSVFLEFDEQGNPVCFRCVRYRYGTAADATAADLTRKDLVAALVKLHPREKKWWQFWYIPPQLPDNWVP